MTDPSEFQPQECCEEPPLPSLTESESLAAKGIVKSNSVEVAMSEVIGASFLGLLCLILLVMYILSQRRNRRLTVELAKRAPRLAILDRPHRKASHG